MELKRCRQNRHITGEWEIVLKKAKNTKKTKK
jgi:hypothetical protein